MKSWNFVPGWLIEKLYYSKVARIAVPIFEYLTKNQTLKLYRIQKELLIEVNLSKPAERAIPFNAYEPLVTREFLNVLKEGDVVLDVGAWIGYYVILAAKKANRVIAIEADDNNCQRIRRNIGLNRFSNVIIVNVAAAEESSSGILLEGPSSSMNKIRQPGPSTRSKTIKTEPLDDIISKYKITEVNLLIMDIEGYEYFALKGLCSSLQTHIVKNIICEIHPTLLTQYGCSNNDVLNLLSKCGYSVRELQSSITSHPYHIYAKAAEL